MPERLWSLTRGDECAIAVLEDCGVNGFELKVTIAGAVLSTDRFVTRELAVEHATGERLRLERIGWR